MRPTHLLTLAIAATSVYVLYQKLNNVSPENQPVPPEPAAQTSPVPEKPQQPGPEKWVRGLPTQAQAKFFEIRTSLRGNDRIQALRSWMALWNKQLRDPDLSYVEFDYIDFNIKNRSPVLYVEVITGNRPNIITSMVKAPDYLHAGPWKQEFQQRLSTLDSMENMLRFIRVRSASHPVLQTMTGEFTDRLTAERAQLAEFRRYFDDSRLR